MAHANINMGVLQEKTYWGCLRSGFGGIQVGGIRHSELTLRRRDDLLPVVAALRSGGAPKVGSEFHQLPSGDRVLDMVHR